MPPLDDICAPLAVPVETLAAGDLVLLRNQPLAPPVRVTGITVLRWGGVRFHWQHEARGFGKAPQSTDDSGCLAAIPRRYVPPPAGDDAAVLRWLDANRGWLADTYGAGRVAAARRMVQRRLTPTEDQQAALRASAAIVEGIRARAGRP